VRLIYSKEQQQWRIGRLKSKRLQSKNGHAQKHRQTVRGTRGVGPEEEKAGYGGKDLQKRKALLNL